MILSDYMNAFPDDVTEYIGKVKGANSHTSLYGNSVYHISGDKNDIILKVSDPRIRGNSLKNEYSVIKKIYGANAKIPAPKPYSFYYQNNLFFFIEEYLAGESLRAIMLPNHNGLRRDGVSGIARLLREIHDSCPENMEINELLEEQLELAEENLREGKVDLSEFNNMEEARLILNLLHKNRPENLTVSLLHGDFRPKNILWNNGSISGIIDWEHSFYGDPYYDIAIMFYYLNDEEKQLFIENYGLNYFDDDKLKYFNSLSLFLNI